MRGTRAGARWSTVTEVTRTHWSLVGLELLVALSAIYGGIGLIWDDVIGMPDSWLTGTPFTSWVVPGVLLLLVVALPMIVAAGLESMRSVWAPIASITAGGALVAWIGVQLLVMQRYNVLQPVMLGVGLAVMALAIVVRRHEPLMVLRRDR